MEAAGHSPSRKSHSGDVSQTHHPQPVRILLKTHRPFSRAFTILEILVVIAIIAVLATLAVPLASRVMAQGRSAKCVNHLRQLGIAVLRYAGENEMTLPVTTHQRRSGYKSWALTLQQYAEGAITFRCPCDEDALRPYTYAINDYFTPNPAGAPELNFSRLSGITRPSESILFAEASKDYAYTDHFHFTDYVGATMPPEIFADQVAVERHLGGANYLFADAHVETLSWERVQALLSASGSRFVDPTAEPMP